MSEALQTGDFKDLNRLVSQTVAGALNEAGRHISTGDGRPQGNVQNFSQGGTTGTQTGAQSFSHSGTAGAQAGAQSFSHGGTAGAQAGASAQQTQAGASAWRQQQIQAGASAWKQQLQTGASVWQQQAQAKLQQTKQNLRLKEEQLRRREALVTRSLNTHSRPPAVSNIKFKKVGNVSNVLYQVFGGIGLGITGFVTFIHMMVFFFSQGTLWNGWILNVMFLALFFGMIQLGISQRRRLKRAARYVQLCDYRIYGEIETLARHTGKSRQYVVKDLEKMLKLGIFPEGHLDEGKTCLMLNDEVYRQYLDSERNRRFKEEERMALEQKETAPQAPPQVSGEQKSELDAMVAEGMECIRKLRDLNDRISGEAISAKLFRLENLLKDIFESVREHPEQMHHMHKLMSYYLPTTLKLVEAYEEFNRVSEPGAEITEAKSEIENTLDTINQAFTELLNNLFQDAAFDATTDAQVLKTMLASEGLTREMEYVPAGRN